MLVYNVLRDAVKLTRAVGRFDGDGWLRSIKRKTLARCATATCKGMCACISHCFAFAIKIESANRSLALNLESIEIVYSDTCMQK